MSTTVKDTKSRSWRPNSCPKQRRACPPMPATLSRAIRMAFGRLPCGAFLKSRRVQYECTWTRRRASSCAARKSTRKPCPVSPNAVALPRSVQVEDIREGEVVKTAEIHPTELARDQPRQSPQPTEQCRPGLT